MRRGRPPARRTIRYLVVAPSGKGWRYHWQPPTVLKKKPNRPAWLKNTALGPDAAKAIPEAERLNALLDGWRKDQDVTGEMAGLIRRYLASSWFTKLRPSTKAGYRDHADVLREDLGAYPLAIFTPGRVALYRERMLEKQVGARVADYRLAVLRRIFSFARKHDLVAINPAASPGSKKAAARQTTWTREQLRLVIAAASPPVALAIRLAIYTLQRQGDILVLRWTDYDGRTIRLRQGKTGQAVTLPVHPRLRAALKLTPRKSEFIVATRRGSGFTSDGFRTVFAKACQDVAAPRPTFHDLRRTSATWLKMGRLEDEHIMLWTGHKRRSDTSILDTYVVAQGEMRALAFPVMSKWRV